MNWVHEEWGVGGSSPVQSNPPQEGSRNSAPVCCTPQQHTCWSVPTEEVRGGVGRGRGMMMCKYFKCSKEDTLLCTLVFLCVFMVDSMATANIRTASLLPAGFVLYAEQWTTLCMLLTDELNSSNTQE